jgi:hypothetical protein
VSFAYRSHGEHSLLAGWAARQVVGGFLRAVGWAAARMLSGGPLGAVLVGLAVGAGIVVLLGLAALLPARRRPSWFRRS